MSPKTLSVLCFGDSLTSGYYAMGLESHPYSIAFAAKVQEALPDTKLHVYTNGRPGDVASFQPFRQRLQTECECKHVPSLAINSTRGENSVIQNNNSSLLSAVNAADTS